MSFCRMEKSKIQQNPLQGGFYCYLFMYVLGSFCKTRRQAQGPQGNALRKQQDDELGADDAQEHG